MSYRAILTVAFFSLLAQMTIVGTWGLIQQDKGQMAGLFLILFTVLAVFASIATYQSSEVEEKEIKSKRRNDHTMFPMGVFMVMLTLMQYCLIIGLLTGILEPVNVEHGHIIEGLLLGTGILNMLVSFLAIGILP